MPKIFISYRRDDSAYVAQTVYDKLSNLHDEQGYISDDDIASIAAEFHLPPAHVRSTAKFYEELSHDKPATHNVKICNGEACRAADCTQRALRTGRRPRRANECAQLHHRLIVHAGVRTAE